MRQSLAAAALLTFKQAVELRASLCRLYYAISVVAGALQATGWPAVVGVMANWFGKGKRGLVMGIWSSHTCVGNIIGSIVAAQALSHGWGWSFILPGCMLSAGSVLVYTLLVEQPADLSVGRQVDSPRVPLAQAIVRFCDLAVLVSSHACTVFTMPSAFSTIHVACGQTRLGSTAASKRTEHITRGCELAGAVSCTGL